MIRILVREYGASEGTILDFEGEREEQLSDLMIAHAELLRLHVLVWLNGEWTEVE